MKKVFLDTNVWLRLFVKQDPAQFKSSFDLISKIEKGQFKAYTSTIVFLEIHYVAQKLYKIPKEQILIWFDSIKEIRNLTIIEKTKFNLALEYFQKYSVKLADCLIVSQLPPKTVLVTFDKDFKKIKEIKSLEPSQI